MKKTKALEKLNTLIENIEELKQTNYKEENPLLDKFQHRVERHLTSIFENNNKYIKRFKEIHYFSFSLVYTSGFNDEGNRYQDDNKAYHSGLIEAQTLIESAIEEIKEGEDTEEDKILKNFNDLLNDIMDLKQIPLVPNSSNPELEKWEARVIRILEKTYGKKSKNIKIFKNILFDINQINQPFKEQQHYYLEGLERAKILVEIILEEINNKGFESLISEAKEVESIVFNGHNNEVSMEGFQTKKTIVNGHNNTFVKQSSKELDKTKVFIVHGHDDQLKTEVELFLKNLDLTPIILHKQANMGKTIIEKIEHYTDVGFGIVLYTPCDEGKAKKETYYKDRARQNVVFEHGFLIGSLGRDRVAFLTKGKIGSVINSVSTPNFS